MPARAYSWPPFEKGNQASRTHGVYAADVAVEAREVITWLYDPSAVERYPAMALVGAEVWVRWRRALAYVEQQGMVLDDGAANPMLVVADRCERKLLDLSARFGLDPRSEMELRKAAADASHAGFDLAAAIEAGREVIDGRVLDAGEEPSA